MGIKSGEGVANERGMKGWYKVQIVEDLQRFPIHRSHE